jgi:CDP-4-dehydro-6-deoxyglucose reductase, E1
VLKDLSDKDIVMNRMFWVGIHPGLTKPALDSLADPIREHMPRAPR